MKLRRCARALLIAIAACSVTATSQLSEEEIRGIRQAAPHEASAKPLRPRTLLVFSRYEGYRHSAIDRAAFALEYMGKQTGAYVTVVSDNMSILSADSLRRFDAVCFNNTTQLQFDAPGVRANLLEFIASGKGIVGIHAATDNFPTWPEGRELWGGYFDSHPWTAEGTWAVKIEDPTHPVVASFQGKDFAIRDEIYRIHPVNLRENCRVLLALDMKAEPNRKAPGVRPDDRDLPISWVRTYGKGRLFYSSLGHNHEVYANPAVLRHYLDGIQFALGDLSAPTTPLPFEPMGLFDQGRVARLLTSIAGYNHGDSRVPLSELDGIVRTVWVYPETRRRLEADFLKFLQGNGTPAGKLFICQQLGAVGSDASVSPLLWMANDPATAEMSLAALGRIEGPSADSALLALLKSDRTAILPTAARLTGSRGISAAAPMLGELLNHSDPAVITAAATALGQLGTEKGARTLLEILRGATKKTRSAIADALLASAAKLQFTNPAAAADLYTSLMASAETGSVRGAALRGLVYADRSRARVLLVNALRDSDREQNSIAARILGEINSVEAAREIARITPDLPAPVQSEVITAFGLYPDAEVRHAVHRAVGSSSSDVRLSALQTLGGIGDATSVPVVSASAAKLSGVEKKVARASLLSMSATAVDDTIISRFMSEKGDVKLELLKAITDRRIRHALPMILRNFGQLSGLQRAEAARALRFLGSDADLPAMISLLPGARDNSERREMEIAIAAVAGRVPDPAKRDRAVIDAYTAGSGTQEKVSYLNVLGRIGAPASFPTLQAAMVDPNADLRRAAIRALSDWPTPEPYNDLRSAAMNEDAHAHRVLALRGVVRMIGLDSSRSADNALEAYRDAMKIAPGLQEKKGVLAAIGEVQSVTALRMASDLLEDQSLRPEAEAALLQVASEISDSNYSVTADCLRKLISSSTDETRVKKAKELLRKLERQFDYIAEWEFAGPYAIPGRRLINETFMPELGDETLAGWRKFENTTDPKRPWLLDFASTFPGEDLVVYTRTLVWSPEEQRATLEAGSDYAVKAWLNGMLVHSFNSVRAVSPGSDRVPVLLRKGWNRVMMKFERGDGPWGGTARIRLPDGDAVAGLRTSLTMQ